MSDDLDRAKEGDREALGRLLARQQARFEAIVRARLAGALQEKARASDLLQSGYLQVIRKLPDFRGESEEEFTAWVARILENRIRQRRRFYAAGKREAAREAEFDTSADDATPSTEACRVEDLKILAEAMDALPEDYRRVILMRVAEDKSHEAIGEELGRSSGATRMLLSRARATLALEIDKRDRPPSA